MIGDKEYYIQVCNKQKSRIIKSEHNLTIATKALQNIKENWADGECYEIATEALKKIEKGEPCKHPD